MPRVDSPIESLFVGAQDVKHRRRILVADDDPVLRSLLGAVLRKDGHDIVEACDGREAFVLIDETLAGCFESPGFDLVISDVHMPSRSGLDLLEELAGCPTAPPIVLMTAFATEELRSQATRLGAFAVIDKPFDLRELGEVIEVAFIWGDARKGRAAGTGHHGPVY